MNFSNSVRLSFSVRSANYTGYFVKEKDMGFVQGRNMVSVRLYRKILLTVDFSYAVSRWQ